MFTPLEIMPRCSAPGLGFIIIPAGFNAPLGFELQRLEFLTGFTIKAIGYRKILNSHVEFTNEYITEFEDGSVGVAGSPQGKTISIYEDKKISIDSKTIIKKLEEDGYIGQPRRYRCV